MFKEGCRIEIFADELRRRSEENQRNAQSDSTTLSERSIIDIDNSTAKQIREPSLDPNFGPNLVYCILYTRPTPFLDNETEI